MENHCLMGKSTINAPFSIAIREIPEGNPNSPSNPFKFASDLPYDDETNAFRPS